MPSSRWGPASVMNDCAAQRLVSITVTPRVGCAMLSTSAMALDEPRSPPLGMRAPALQLPQINPVGCGPCRGLQARRPMGHHLLQTPLQSLPIQIHFAPFVVAMDMRLAGSGSAGKMGFAERLRAAGCDARSFNASSTTASATGSTTRPVAGGTAGCMGMTTALYPGARAWRNNCRSPGHPGLKCAAARRLIAQLGSFARVVDGVARRPVRPWARGG